MARLQYKICTNPEQKEHGYIDVLVFVREIPEPGCFMPWVHVTTRRTYVEPILSTHGRRLKALLHSLA